jgi:hypothetical protein
MPDGADWIVSPDDPIRLRASEDYVVLEDHWIPRTIEYNAGGARNDGPDPEVYIRVEVDPDGPKLRELSLLSTDPDARGIRQGDLRDIKVGMFTEDLVAAFTIRIDRDPGGHVDRAVTYHQDQPAHLRFVGRLRAGRTSRDITPDLLERVAKVYRDNIAGYPTKAVQHHFQVSQRMAAEYVSRARKRGLLPPTKRGKKNA